MQTLERRRTLQALLEECRARLDPDDVGLPESPRAAPGLRRDEVADLLDVSPARYASFESGYPDRRFSTAFVDRVADALLLDERERGALFRLAIPDVAAAAEHYERSRHDGALQGMAKVRELARTLLAASSFEEGATTAAEMLQSVVCPSCASLANLAARSEAPLSITVRAHEEELGDPVVAAHLIALDYPGRYGETTFNEDRPRRDDVRDGSFSFRQRLAHDGRSFTVTVAPNAESRSGEPALEAEAAFALHDVTLDSDAFWSWNDRFRSRAGLGHGIFDRGVYRGNVVIFWSEPHAMRAEDVEIAQTVGALLELASAGPR